MSQAPAPPFAFLDVKALRRRFKTVCAATDNRFQNFQIRVHRALSWFERAVELDEGEHPDGRLLYGWIALNALYGAWDPSQRTAAREMESCRKFLSRLVAADADGVLGKELTVLRPDVVAILENKFLDPIFWKNPSAPGNIKAKARRAPSWYYEQRWCDLLACTLERIYVLRGQIVHGASTRGSRLNRATLARCRKVLEALVAAILPLVIERMAHDDWPPLCYPPIEEK